VGAFDERAPDYESGRHGRLHREIAGRTVQVALGCAPGPRRILDVGCGTGYALRQLDPRLRFVPGTAERLPAADGSVDLVISTTSFDHWADQQAGLAECARVLAPGGYLVLADIISAWLLPTLGGSRRGKARTRRRVTRLLAAAELREPRWHRRHALIIGTVTAVR
jgi:ubiquinone/menaquinone biosynthesis C-methylase UbiE